MAETNDPVGGLDAHLGNAVQQFARHGGVRYDGGANIVGLDLLSVE